MWPLYTGVSFSWDLAHIEPLSTGAWSARFDDLWRDDQSLLHDQDTSIIIVDATVVSARVDCDTLATSKSVHALLADLISTDHNLQLVVLQELVNDVRTEESHVVLFLRVSRCVWMNTQDVVVACWITPQEFHGHLLGLVINLAKSDLQWSLDLLDVINLLKGGTDTSMHTEDLVVGSFISDDSGHWQILIHVVQFLEDTIGVVDIFTKTASTLLSQTQVLIDVAVLVVSSKQEDLLWILELQSHQQANDFKGLATFVDVVAQEEVIVATDVT